MNKFPAHATGVPDRRWITILIAGLGALLVFRLVALKLNATDLFFDEAQYWYWSLEPAFGYYSKPPLIAWMIRIATDSCGLSEFCIRLPSPIMHTATAAIVFLIGSRLFDTRTGVVSALVFATLPGISLSSGIISTDVPLLFFWAVGLYAFVALLDTRAWWPAILLGLALGFGLNAKYAMAWFILCSVIYIAATPARWKLFKDVRLYVALGIAILLITPNLAWNWSHAFATFSHTADNAKWGGQLLNPGKALEFFGAQFGVFGPILFGALLIISWRYWRHGLPPADRVLLAFSLPVILIITMQAFVSRAHANWAATAYVAATLLVVATMLRELDFRWLKASFAVHFAVLMLLAAGTAIAGRIVSPAGADPFERTLGWREVAAATRAELELARSAGRPFVAVISDDRPLTAELLYYMRDEPTPVLAWRSRERPQDHFELMRPFTASVPDPVLLVSLAAEPLKVTRAFFKAERLGAKILPAGKTGTRRITFHSLAGYRPE